ncbi:pituitary tumor-transforming gene 1 protein-interacting protein-like [Rhinatrema bivittatum]|uniref:pituitary tumor-transforming gene 1 protein-interacting protein-like n=1 Tax=Rhinatrema bivittatum TaxID=194408 RepID=UPI001126EC5E|nr:pituitary tumor-transforming gene 1 protein-interacting protein-like [Rhinatrema bivittatum]
MMPTPRRPFLLLLLGAGSWICCPGSASTVAPAPVLQQPCSHFTSKTCEQCLSNVSCLWCNTNKTCMDYPVRSIFPSSSLCSLSDARWGFCWMNFEAFLITISVLAGILLLSFSICCCYCCYCRKQSRRLGEEEERFIAERDERRLQALKRKNERKAKHDEIRKKYGLLQDLEHPYSKFENE